MPKTLEAQDKLIREIFEGNYQFEIPEYQRPYAWTTDQTTELFDDLYAAMVDSRSSNAAIQYFLGSIVLIKNDRDPKSSVVDGQQRLSTLTIMLAVLRDAMPDATDDITEFLYKKGKISLGEKNQYRLTAREEDADFFRTYIQEPGGITKLIQTSDILRDSRLRYRENAALLREKIFALPDQERNELWRFIANHCSLVVISTPDLDSAYRIFSVLTNRGLDLAPIDILKANILGQIRKTKNEALRREYAKKWSGIELALGREAFGELFSHIRSIYAKRKQKQTLIKEFLEHVTESNNPQELIDNVIIPYARIWEFVRSSEFESKRNADKINEYLSYLNRANFKDWVPPTLLYFKTFEQNAEFLERFLLLVERLTYFMIVTRVNIYERIESFAALSKEIEAKGFDGDPDKLSTLSLDNAQKRDFIDHLNGDIYRKLAPDRMSIMLRLESLVSDGSKKLVFNHLTLEHVLPQNPGKGSDWDKYFPSESEREYWTHRLANLVPLHTRKNPAAGNFDFSKKKKIYLQGKGGATPFVLTQEVGRSRIWTPKVLERRQKRLLDAFKAHWELTIL